jgi:hypothetical protein
MKQESANSDISAEMSRQQELLSPGDVKEALKYLPTHPGAVVTTLSEMLFKQLDDRTAEMDDVTAVVFMGHRYGGNQEIVMLSRRPTDEGLVYRMETTLHSDLNDGGGEFIIVADDTDERHCRVLAHGWKYGEWNITELEGKQAQSAMRRTITDLGQVAREYTKADDAVARQAAYSHLKHHSLLV